MSLSIKAGQEGFRWFFATVENRDDEKQVGRIQIRIHGIHPPEKSLVKTADLPWAYVIMPPNSAGLTEVGTSPTGILVGSTVFGFFADANECQIPIVMGTLAGIPKTGHDVPSTARGTNNVKKTTLGPEPASAYAAQYPYNKVIQTEGNHVIEIDDTPGQERIHVFHKSGTYTEINADGRKVDKVADDNYHIVAGNEEVYIQGNVNVRVVGNVNILVDGTYTLESKGKMTLKAPRIDLNP